MHLELVEKVQKHPRVTALTPIVLSIARLKASLQGCHTVHPMARSGLGPCDAPRAPPATNTRGTHSSKRARPVPGSIPGLDHCYTPPHHTTPHHTTPPRSTPSAAAWRVARPRARVYFDRLSLFQSQNTPNRHHTTLQLATATRVTHGVNDGWTVW